VAGADEAGRGCLAGPLVSAAVLIDYGSLSRGDRRCLTGLDDSKRLTREERERLYLEILRIAARVSVVTRCAAGIDRRGLHRTNIEALSSALQRLEPAEAICLVDGFALPGCPIEHRRVVKGDATSAAIAAASIVAKVSRDRQMERLHRLHPHWGFADHVGYATAAHHEAIRRHGPSPIHRLSFASSAYA
jgi:ribonuclease HII